MICLGKALEALNDDSVEFKAYKKNNKNQHWKKGKLDKDDYFTLENVELEKFLTAYFDSENDAKIEGKPNYKGLMSKYVTFHEQQECVYDFSSLSLATPASANVSELVFEQEWQSHESLKTILTHPLRHTWPEVVMGNHTHTSAVHGKSFHKGLTKQS